MTETLSDKPWSFTGFGTIRCGRHTVLHLNLDLPDEVTDEEFQRIGRLAAAAPSMHDALKLALLELDRLQRSGKFVDPPTVAIVRHALRKTDAQDKT